MQSLGYWNKQVGIANSSSQEVLYLCWQGRIPKTQAKSREHVDIGSGIYIDFMKNVPLLSDHDILKVDQQTKESVMPLLGVDGADAAEDEDESEEGDTQASSKRKYPKRFSGRALFRTASNPEATVLPG